MSRTLAYGDIIRIYCSLQDNRDGGNKIGGFLISKGFADTNIYFLKCEKFTQFQLRNALFEILPYSSFEIHDEAKKKKAESKGGKGDTSQSVKSSMKTQEEQFKSKIAKEKKMEINFDSEVVIKHVNSDSYLQGQFSCPETGIGSFKLILSVELSSDVKFKITRFRNSDKEAEQIQSKDQFILYHCASHCYLNIGDLGEKVFLDKEIKIAGNNKCEPSHIARQDNEAYKYINQRPFIKRPNEGSNKFIERYEVVNMSKPTLILNFLLQKSSRDDYLESQIQHNDVVYIRNTNNMSYLTADLWSGQVSLVSYNGQRSGDFPYQGIWEVCVPRESQRGQVSNIKNYFLKHYITDKICQVETDGSELKRIGLDQDMTFNKSMNSFKILNYQHKKNLNHRDLIFLEVCDSKTHAVLHTTPNTFKQQPPPIPSFLDIGNKIQKVHPTKLQQKREEEEVYHSLQMTKGPLDNAFQIFKLEDKKLKQINKILSCVQILTNFCDVLIVLDNIISKEISRAESGQKQSQTDNYINPNTSNYSERRATKQLMYTSFSVDEQDSIMQKFLADHLNYYIINLVINTISYLIKNFKKSSKKPDFQFMMMIRSLGLIEILIETIFFIKRNFSIIRDWESQLFKKKKFFRDRLDQCFKLIYQLLLELSTENSCRLYLGRWFSLFMNQFHQLREDNIHALIVDLLKEKFIIKTLGQSYIKECIKKIDNFQNVGKSQVMHNTKNYKYLELLSSFCRAKNTAIEKNQSYIMEQIGLNPGFFYKFAKQEGPKDEIFVIHYSDETSQALYKYKGNWRWNYVIYLLNLYADLIYNHSYADDNIKHVEDRISMETVEAFFRDREEYEDYSKSNETSIGANIIDSFLKLAHYFFLNQLNKLNYPTRMIDRENTLYIKNRSQSDQGSLKDREVLYEREKPYDTVIMFVEDFLKKEQKELTYNTSRLKTIETSLDFIKTVSKLDNKWKLVMNEIIRLIIKVVIKLKRGLVYNELETLVMPNRNPTEASGDEKDKDKDKDNQKGNDPKKIDQRIASNIKQIRKDKSQERLLIDTRSAAVQILNIKLNNLINQGLTDINKFFTEVCDNVVNIELCNNSNGSNSDLFGDSGHWIWINKIKDVSEKAIDDKLKKLIDDDDNGKETLAKLLIECIFVESLKIVNKIVMLIFRMYELRKTLAFRFKDSFVVLDEDFKAICQENMKLVTEFEKTKPGDKLNYNRLMASLETINFAMRYFDKGDKLKLVRELYNLKAGDDQSNKQRISNIVGKLRQGLSIYIVLNETETKLATNQTLLQKMVANQKIHVYVVSYIKGLKEGMASYTEHLNIAYQFLTLLVYNNNRNKKLFCKDIRFVLSHIGSNCRAVEFLKKVVVENQNIINNRELVNELVVGILESAHQIDEDEDKLIIKAKLIDTLRVFCVYENKTHVENQSLIMVHMQNKKYQNSIMFSTQQYNSNKNLDVAAIQLLSKTFQMGMDSHRVNNFVNPDFQIDSYQQSVDRSEQNSINYRKYVKIKGLFTQFREDYNKALIDADKTGKKDQFVVLPPLLLYLTAYFTTMSALVENNHEINKGKCCNIHSFDSLVELIEDCNRCWPVIRHVRSYIIKLFYYTNPNKVVEKGNSRVKPYYSNLNSQILPKRLSTQAPKDGLAEFSNLVSKLFPKEISLLTERFMAINNELLHEDAPALYIKISTPIRYQYMSSYIYCCLQELMYQVKLFFSELQSYGRSVDFARNNKLSKQHSQQARKFLITLGITYQYIMRNDTGDNIKSSIQTIFESCVHVVKVIDCSGEVQQAYPSQIKENEKLVDEITRDSKDLLYLKRQLETGSNTEKYNFVLYHFFISQRVQSRPLIHTGSSKSNSPDYKVMANDENDIKIESYVRRIIPTQKNLKPDTQAKILAQLENSDKQIRVNKLLEVITEGLMERQQTQEMIQQELYELVKLCSQLDSECRTTKLPQSGSVENLNYRVIGYDVFMMNIISLVTKSPFHLTLEGKIKTIQLIRLIFQYKVNKNCKDNKKQWQSGFFQGDNLKSLQDIQEAFRKLNLDKMIVAILQEQTQSYQLLLETFKLGIKFLFNGNSECQSAILSNLQLDPQNMVMVQLFNFIKKMRSQISQGKFIIQKEDQSKESKGNNLQCMLLDNFQYLDISKKYMMPLGTEKESSKESELEVDVKIQCVCQAYQFLQLLCENDNQVSKNFLRQQTNANNIVKYNSINFVSETSKLFKVVLQNCQFQQKQSSILQYLADFFIEVTQLPCTENQLELCSTSIFSDIKFHSIRKQEQQAKQSQLKSRSNINNGNNMSQKRFASQTPGSSKIMCYLLDFVINAGLSLLEGGSSEIYNSLISSLDLDFIDRIFNYQKKVLQVLKKSQPECPLIHEFNDETLRILLNEDDRHVQVRKRIYMVYNMFSLVQKLSKYMREHKTNPTEPTLIDKLIEKAALRDSTTNLSQLSPNESFQPDAITIRDFFKNKLKHIEVVFQQKKQYLYFPDLPIFKKLSDEYKQQILEDIKRQTQVDKITSFLVKSSEINNLMKWNYKVEDKLALSTQFLDSIRLDILLLTLVIVGLYIMFTSVSFIKVNGRREMLKSMDNSIIDSLVNFLCILHLFTSVYFMFTWCTLKYRMPVERQLKQELGVTSLTKLLNKIDKDQAFQLKDYWVCIKLMLKNQPEVFNILFFIVVSFMGYFLKIEYYSLLAFDGITRNKILKNVIQAITSNITQLFVVSMLILAFVYVFNIMSIEFSLYLPLIYEDEDEKCSVLSDCVISLYTSGEIGEKHKEFKFSKFLADLFYIVIMELLFSNIVSGIVIDTFAQLRDQRKTIEIDTETKCFICGISKAALEKELREREDDSIELNSELKRFQKHTLEVHYQWDYIYYLYILSQKDITTYTGIEYFIKKQYMNDQYDWIPTHEEDDDKEIKEILEITRKLVPKVKERLQNKNQLTN